MDGLRVTDEETLEVVEMVLSGSINKAIVQAIHDAGGQAIGLSGKDGKLILAEKVKGKDIGFVGDVVGVNGKIIEGYLRFRLYSRHRAPRSRRGRERRTT